MKTTKAATLRNCTKQKIDLAAIVFKLKYSGNTYEVTFHNSFNVQYHVIITENGLPIKGFNTASNPTPKLCIELIKESKKN